jgi:predicted amidohydrolase
MRIRAAQFAIHRDLASNLRHILGVLRTSQPGEMVVFPEGALSGYAPKDPAYTAMLDAAAIEEAIGQVKTQVQATGCRCLLGSATKDGQRWRNAVLMFDGPAEPRRYFKAELSGLDRRHFEAGPAAGAAFPAGGVTIGVVACRELLFPGVWMQLKSRGAQVVFHLNNAIEPHDALWTHLLIARAIEQGVFVCSVNNATAPQALPSLLIAPSGRVILRTEVESDQVLAADIDLSDVIAELGARVDY